AHLTAIDARHLFASNMTRLALRRGTFLRSYVYEFVRSFASPLTREVVDQAMAAAPVAGFDI
ncbi:MAG TPA: transcriptional regulator, partial [Rubrivivax sp.]|nr:transcriptional regulator [Rubrivivax sp.]